MRNGAVFLEGFKVLFGPITFVFFEIILGVLLIEFLKIMISANFGEDGGCSHIKAIGVAFYHVS